ncbi:uncharacterized protein WCC33_017055 [Rhinophrynus dorsalis]
MSFFQCFGCCVATSEEESKPFAREVKDTKIFKPLNRDDRLVVKHVGVPGIDKNFTDIANFYNEQVEHHETMTQCMSALAEASHSSPNLTSCIQRLKEEYNDYNIRVQMEGYNFSLLMKTEEDLPEKLEQAQEYMKKLSRATKLLIGNQTRLGEMVFTVLQTQNKNEMIDKIKEFNTGYLDQVRLTENLEENLRKIDQARQLSKEYEEEANNILKEVAEIAGATL